VTSVSKHAAPAREHKDTAKAMAMALASTARTVPVRATVPGERGVTSRRVHAVTPRPIQFCNVTRSARRPVRPAAALGPNEVNELAASTLLTMSGLETVLGKVSFGSLLTATSIYEYKVRHRNPRTHARLVIRKSHRRRVTVKLTSLL